MPDTGKPNTYVSYFLKQQAFLQHTYACLCSWSTNGKQNKRPVNEKEKSIFIPGIQESEQAELLRVCSVGLTFVHSFVSSRISQTLSVYCAVQKRCVELA